MIVSIILFAAQRRSARFVVLGLITLMVAAAAYWYWHIPRLNVILVTFDTTRADRLGAYGYTDGLTQGFDDFAKRGVIFNRAYAPAPITLPSHATMLTGLYPPEHGLRSNGLGRLDRRIPFLPEILKENGYDTGAFIAAIVLDSKHGLDRGFDTYDDNLSKPTQDDQDHLSEPRRDGREVVDLALSWLRKRTTRPFFCWIHLFDAHAPYNPRSKVFGDKFVDRKYDAGVAWEVQQFERLTTFLRDQGLEATTLVVVAGDHGEGLDDHLESEHGMLLYNTTVQVPLAFVGPHGCRPGTRVPESVSLVDLTPTLLDVLRIPGPKHVSGRSLLGALNGKGIEPRDCYAETNIPFVYNHWSPLLAVISDRWKYIQTTRPELYDLENDPDERSNLAESAGETLEEMRASLEILQAAFVPAAAENLRLSDKDRANLQALGYVAGGKLTNKDNDLKEVEILPDVKDMLPHLVKFDAARHLSMQRKLEESIALLRQIVEATDKFPAAELLLGECLAQLGRLDDAVECYRTVLANRPDFVGANFTLGKIFMAQGRFEEAAAEFRAFIKQDPDGSAAHFELGQTLTNLEKFDDAIAEFREVIRLEPESAGAYISLGQLLTSLGRSREAAESFEQALVYDPRAAMAHQYLMILLAQSGQAGVAIEHGKKAVALEPGAFEARFNLGVLLVAQRRYAEGIAELRAAQKLQPDDPRLAPQIQQAEAALRRLGR